MEPEFSFKRQVKKKVSGIRFNVFTFGGNFCVAASDFVCLFVYVFHLADKRTECQRFVFASRYENVHKIA